MANVKEIEAKTGKPMTFLIEEVRRQISEALRGGNPIKGDGVTKSGGDDGY